jgi:hypothetical protein
MVFEATARLDKGCATITSNGNTIEVMVDVPVIAVATGDTPADAKRLARTRVARQSFGIIHTKIAEATLALPEDSKGGRISTNYAIWQNINIIKFQKVV